MRILDIYRTQGRVVSFEFFPPKTDKGMSALFDAMRDFIALEPSFVSVTYGAMGSTRRKTVDLVRRIKHDMGMEVMCHLSCIGSTREEINEVLDELWAAEIENVLALGGDPPADQGHPMGSNGGFSHANELAAHIKTKQHFCIGGACYPEGHIDAPSKEVDLFFCKKKVEDGVDFLITQLFFDNRDYFEFVDRARKVGIEVPIVPGIMPITNFSQIKRFTEVCGSKLPREVEGELARVADDLEAVEAYGIAYATRQCRELLDRGAPGIHFYTLNKTRATTEILADL